GAPAPALPDQLDLGGALAHEQALGELPERRHVAADRLAERRTGVAEDPRIAVARRTDGRAHPESVEHARQHVHRMLAPGILDVRLDPPERRLRLDALDLELRHEHELVALRRADERDRPLGGEIREAGEVADQMLVEEHVAREPVRAAVGAQALPPRGMLVRGDADRHDGKFYTAG